LVLSHHMKHFLATFLIFLFFCGYIFGEQLSLAELVDIALKNNPETEQVWWNTKRARAVVGIAESSNYPDLDLKGGLSHAREKKFPNGPNTVFTSYSAELCLSYLLYDFGERRAEIEATKEALNSAKWSSDFAIQSIIYKVSANYYQYLNAQELLKTKESSLKDAELILKSAEDLHKAGLRLVNDLNTSKAALAQIQMDLAEQRAQVAISYGNLLTVLGLSIETQLNVQPMPEEMQDPRFSEGVSTLISMAQEKRADLLAKKANVAEMKARVRRANRAPLPKLRALGEGGWLQYTRHQGNSYNYSAGVALGMPIFKGFEYTYQKRLALANAEMSTAELKELQEEIALEVLTYSESVKAAQEALKWSQEYVDEATKSYEGSLESYKAGLQNIFDLLQTQRYLSDARIKRAQAKTQWLVSLAELAFATGSIMP
jgi:outer membrane protein